jgi:hypothetical protein
MRDEREQCPYLVGIVNGVCLEPPWRDCTSTLSIQPEQKYNGPRLETSACPKKSHEASKQQSRPDPEGPDVLKLLFPHAVAIVHGPPLDCLNPPVMYFDISARESLVRKHSRPDIYPHSPLRLPSVSISSPPFALLRGHGVSPK